MLTGRVFRGQHLSRRKSVDRNADDVARILFFPPPEGHRHPLGLDSTFYGDQVLLTPGIKAWPGAAGRHQLFVNELPEKGPGGHFSEFAFLRKLQSGQGYLSILQNGEQVCSAPCPAHPLNLVRPKVSLRRVHTLAYR